MDTRFRRLLAGTTGLTFVLMLLGVYTASSAAGLTCAGRWPFCDGWLGLFPANWMSFIEWFHRLVAMITGFVILGTTGLAWYRGKDRRTRFALLAAVILLPAQIILGALTVTLNGLFPGGYSPPIQAAHFLTATLVFGLLGYATARTYAPRERSELRAAALLAVALVPLQYLFSFGTVFVYSETVQIIYYTLSLGLFALLVGIVVWVDADQYRRQRLLSGVAAALLTFQMLLGRRLLGSPDRLLSDAVAIGLFACLLAAAHFAYRSDDLTLPVVGTLVGR